ncbi:hypothetical protein V3C99_015308 [Haemonchus contortus]|uniref:cardiolipin synthase (CMP-forming) n=1 Tax=Haemonchus contortus TaxID=6289 RepID=A0A7I4YXG1_HAECO|nr:CDP-alcohol phosphatidyltransferase domain containing protein [Haemonchus contortus]
MFRIGQRLLLTHSLKTSCTCGSRSRVLRLNDLSRFTSKSVHLSMTSFLTSSPNEEAGEDVKKRGSPSVIDRGRYKLSTVPNALCIGRIIATPIAGYLVVQHEFPIAFGLFVTAGVTDMLDGYIARNVPGQQSLLGSVLDPIADKLLVSVMFVTMTYAALIPWQLTFVVLFRDLCLISGGFYKRYRTMEPPYSLKRFFNPEVSSMQVVPTLISKVNTVLQLGVIATSLSIPVFSLSGLASFSTGLCWVTAITTTWSGLQYASGKAMKKV